MPHANNTTLSNLEAICEGLGLQNPWFIVPNTYSSLFNDNETTFCNSVFVGTKEQCEKNLKDFPNHKVV